MDSDDSRDGSGDTRSSSTSSSSSSRSQKNSSSDHSRSSKKGAKSPPHSPRSNGPQSPASNGSRSPGSIGPKSPNSIGPQSPASNGPRSPASNGPRSPGSNGPRSPGSNGPRSPGSNGPRSPGSNGPRSPSPESQSSVRSKSPNIPKSPTNLSEAHSDINSPENSMPGSPAGPKSPDAPKSPSEAGSNTGSPNRRPKSPQSPNSSASSGPTSPTSRSRPASPDYASQRTSPRNRPRSPSSSPSPDRNPVRTPVRPEQWRRSTKAEQKMVTVPRKRSGSDSSQSSRSSTYNKRSSNKDPATEEISDGEMESDQEDRKSTRSKSVASDKVDGKDLNISHEDLSDVSDLDSVGPDDNEKEDNKKKSAPASPLSDSKSDIKINGNNATGHMSPKSDPGKVDTPKFEKVPQEKTSNTEDGEEQLDFEAEEGECIEPKPKEQPNGDADAKIENEDIKAGRRSRGSSLEEGEVSDEAERRPEESEPRPVCRFFSRGACTWGVSCRFLHPGVTDKGNYNMFEVVRGVPTGGAGAYPPARDSAPPESAWERGLRTAKEMLRIANKRKEQDMDFEEKKLHLSVGGVVHDPDAELAYAAAAVGASPPRELPPPHRDPDVYRTYGPMYRGRFPRPPIDERERFYERERERERVGYERERGYERPPPAYDERLVGPEEMAYHKRRVRSSREVIVQRAEVDRREGREGRDGREAREGREGRREGRGDEWADPWMRAEPAARRRRPPSSDDSYSSSSSSNSSSRSSKSPGARRKRRASSSSRQRLSPSVIVRERRMATARATAMNPPAPRRRAPSPTAARQLSANPPAPAQHRHKDEIDPYGRNKASSRNRDRKKYSRSSSSGSESSTSSSESESESHSSSTSGSSGAKRARHARLINAASRPRLNAKSGLAAAVTIPNKKEVPSEKEFGKKRTASSPGEGPPKKSVSRREELLKQLKAVEDAIARKRSKI